MLHLFSVAKATLQPQMSVRSSVCLSDTKTHKQHKINHSTPPLTLTSPTQPCLCTNNTISDHHPHNHASGATFKLFQLVFQRSPVKLKTNNLINIKFLIVFMKPWWNLIKSKNYHWLSYSYDKPFRQHSKQINFDKSWNIFLISRDCLCHRGVEIFWSPNWWNIFQTKMMKYF